MGRESSGPVIGLSCRHPRRPDALLTRIALRLNGARVVLLRPGRPVPWERLHGLVIGGGAHILIRAIMVPSPKSKPIMCPNVTSMSWRF